MTLTRDYAEALNGAEIGSGYDVAIKRTGERSAIVCVTNLATKNEWMQELEVTPEQDLHSLAVEIGQCPGLGEEGWVADDQDAWDALAEKWDNAS